MTASVFAKYEAKAWPYRFNGQMVVSNIVGGVPSDPCVAEGYIKSKLAASDDLLRSMVAEIQVERGVTADEAVEIAAMMKNLNGFKRDEQGLYIEGRQLKAAIKEAASVAVAGGQLKGGRAWGTTNKGLAGFLAEHVMVVEERLHLGVTAPTGINQRFISTFRGTGIQYEEYVEDAKISFTVISDWEFTGEQWAHIWLKGEQQGIGASRSQGFGRYAITAWDPA